MTPKTRAPLLVFATVLAAAIQPLLAAPFQNLDFEQANQSAHNSNIITTVAGLPGWTVMYGSSTENNIWYQTLPLDVTSVTLDVQDALDGNDSVIIYGVNTGIAGRPGSASISQTGDVPGNALSIRFTLLYEGAGPLVTSIPFVSFNGQAIDVFPLSESGNIWQMGGDISTFAGLNGELAFAAIGPPIVGNNIDNEDIFELDDITFSASPVPEPATAALLLAAAPLLMIRQRRARFPGGKR